MTKMPRNVYFFLCLSALFWCDASNTESMSPQKNKHFSRKLQRLAHKSSTMEEFLRASISQQLSPSPRSSESPRPRPRSGYSQPSPGVQGRDGTAKDLEPLAQKSKFVPPADWRFFSSRELKNGRALQQTISREETADDGECSLLFELLTVEAFL